jgi:hypothetical protein
MIGFRSDCDAVAIHAITLPVCIAGKRKESYTGDEDSRSLAS